MDDALVRILFVVAAYVGVLAFGVLCTYVVDRRRRQRLELGRGRS